MPFTLTSTVVFVLCHAHIGLVSSVLCVFFPLCCFGGTIFFGAASDHWRQRNRYI